MSNSERQEEIAIIELIALCVEVDGIRKPVLSDLFSYVAMREPGFKQTLREQIRYANSRPALYSTINGHANSIAFKSERDFVLWLSRLKKALEEL